MPTIQLTLPPPVSTPKARSAVTLATDKSRSSHLLREIRRAYRRWQRTHRASRLKRFDLGRIRIAVGVVALAALIGASINIWPAIQVARGVGTRGVWIATHQVCGQSGCGWLGEFRLLDGKVLLAHADFAGSLPQVAVGTAIPARYPGASDFVYPLRGSHRWVVLLIVMIASVAILIWLCSHFMVGYIRRRRFASDLLTTQ